MGANWFTVEKVDNTTYSISEYHHWEKPHSYLVLGAKKACLIDTGLGIGNIRKVVDEITDLPVEVITTHVHWDHIGGHHLFNNISVHKNDKEWLRNGLPLPEDKIKENLIKDVEKEKFPNNFNVDDYKLFTGEPTHILFDNEIINLGNRKLQVLHTPGHSPGHICLYEKDRGYLFSGDLLYKGTLFAFYPSTNPEDFYKSIVRISEINYIDKILPGHNEIGFEKRFLKVVRQAFEELEDNNLLHHGSGLHEYDSFKIKL